MKVESLCPSGPRCRRGRLRGGSSRIGSCLRGSTTVRGPCGPGLAGFCTFFCRRIRRMGGPTSWILCSSCLAPPKISILSVETSNLGIRFHKPPISSSLLNKLNCRNYGASVSNWDSITILCYLLRICCKDDLVLKDALLIGISSTYRSECSLSALNELHSILFQKKNLTLMDWWKTVQIYLKFQEMHCLLLQNGSLFRPDQCKHSNDQSSWQ